jgi:hypothetical protein
MLPAFTLRFFADRKAVSADPAEIEHSYFQAHFAVSVDPPKKTPLCSGKKTEVDSICQDKPFRSGLN